MILEHDVQKRDLVIVDAFFHAVEHGVNLVFVIENGKHVFVCVGGSFPEHDLALFDFGDFQKHGISFIAR